MDILDDSNVEIVNYFSKFKENKNYNKLLEEFDELTKFRLKRMIELEDLMLPDVGPSDDLNEFTSKLENWPEEDVKEVGIMIKLYDSGEIQSAEEAIILIEILKKEEEKYPEVLDVISEDLKSGHLKNTEKYDELIRLKESNKDHSIIYGSIWSYLGTLLS